jgi:hypothetical protein
MVTVILSTARMTLAPADLATCLARPETMARLALPAWDRLVPAARSAGLLARLAHLIELAGIWSTVPERVRAHLEAERIVADKHARDVRWEAMQIQAALRGVIPLFIVLKGGAYVLAGLPPARGRLFADVDVLVPHDRVADVEAALRRHGWGFGDIDPYDERYYRRFTHQLPPMVHARRRTAIDVHHTIVQVTAPVQLSPAELWREVRLIGDGIAVLSPPDMVLHSAVHLFNDGEFHRGLRDLDDITGLLRHFVTEPGFTERLVERAVALDLVRPLFYALRYSHRLLDGPLSETILDGQPGAPAAAMRQWMDALFARVLVAPHPHCRPAGASLAEFLLYVRAHHLRMPPHLLVPHLLRKAYVRRFGGTPA